ncbi:MAG: alpha-E domain-containing protein [Actinomycetota bacterium]
MLSRVAESVYWTGRYIERAEATSRLLHVKFHALLDGDIPDRGASWRELLLLLGKDALYREHHDEYTARDVADFLLWHPANPDAATRCITQARENARGVREQLSSELWEHLNRMHLRLSDWRPSGILGGPHEFFVRIRDGSFALQGIAKATLPRGDAHEFLELGAHLERADVVARVLYSRAPRLVLASSDARVAELLKSCGGFEACRRREQGELSAWQAVDFLLREGSFPRSVLFCLARCHDAVLQISGDADRPLRALGRVSAELTYGELLGLDATSLGAQLAQLRRGIDAAGEEISATYFTTHVVIPGPIAHQEQQQQ